MLNLFFFLIKLFLPFIYNIYYSLLIFTFPILLMYKEIDWSGIILFYINLIKNFCMYLHSIIPAYEIFELLCPFLVVKKFTFIYELFSFSIILVNLIFFSLIIYSAGISNLYYSNDNYMKIPLLVFAIRISFQKKITIKSIT